MSKLCVLCVLLLAFLMYMPMAGASLGVDMFNFPVINVPGYDGTGIFNQIQASGGSAITAPTMGEIMKGSAMNAHLFPELVEPNWQSSMQKSPINSLLKLMHFQGSSASA